MAPDKYHDAVEVVTNKLTKKGLKRAVKHQSLPWLLDTSAWGQCLAFLAKYEKRNQEQIVSERERYRACSLLFILGAMQAGDEKLIMESLCILGARGVRVLKPTWKERYQAAGEWLERPLTVPRNYERYGHLAHTQQRLADDLYDLVTHPDILAAALAENGATAVAKYL
jgi:hypothetical protein